MFDYQGIIISLPLYTVATLLFGGVISAALLVFHIVVVPLIFKYCNTFRRIIIFVNFVQWPPFIDFEDPASRGVEGGRNLSLEYQSKVDKCRVRIGIWHILPKSVYERLKGSFDEGADKEILNKILDKELANSKTPIIFYCHGNSNSRGASHRTEMYKFFQQMDFHTITFDYRGYGDSTNLRPTEAGVVEDSLRVYEWLRGATASGASVFMWGHSLGTGISSHLLGNLAELSTTLLDSSTPPPPPAGLILEAPFNNLADEVAIFPLTKLVRWLPYFDSYFVDPFRTAPEHNFRSDVHLGRANDAPVLILHAKDDAIVPFSVGVKLYRAVVQSRSAGGAPVTLHAYEKCENLGHKWICHAKDLPHVIGEFVNKHRCATN